MSCCFWCCSEPVAYFFQSKCTSPASALEALKNGGVACTDYATNVITSPLLQETKLGLRWPRFLIFQAQQDFKDQGQPFTSMSQRGAFTSCLHLFPFSLKRRQIILYMRVYPGDVGLQCCRAVQLSWRCVRGAFSRTSCVTRRTTLLCGANPFHVCMNEGRLFFLSWFREVLIRDSLRHINMNSFVKYRVTLNPLWCLCVVFCPPDFTQIGEAFRFIIISFNSLLCKWEKDAKVWLCWGAKTGARAFYYLFHFVSLRKALKESARPSPCQQPWN